VKPKNSPPLHCDNIATNGYGGFPPWDNLTELRWTVGDSARRRRRDRHPSWVRHRSHRTRKLFTTNAATISTNEAAKSVGRTSDIAKIQIGALNRHPIIAGLSATGKSININVALKDRFTVQSLEITVQLQTSTTAKLEDFAAAPL
jgi:hypothetical protein